jgi:hypothetical protein
MNIKRLHRSPAAMLFLLAPLIGELLSGSAPPVEFFHPFGFVLLTSLYGSGALVIRELRVRWNKGIGTTLLLGAAYALIEEGLMVASFFNPEWPDLGQLSMHGRWLGVNWVWVVMLTMYHAVYSIAIPISLVELVYSDRRTQSWVSPRTFLIVFGLFVSVVVFGFFGFTVLAGYTPPIIPYLVTMILVLLFGYAAYHLPAVWGQGDTAMLPPKLLCLLGVAGTFSFFFGFWLMPSIIPFWPLGLFISLILLSLVTAFLIRYQWDKGSVYHRFALVGGALVFFIVFAPLQEFDTTRMDNPTGMTFIAVSCLSGLLLLYRHLNRHAFLQKSRSTRARVNDSLLPDLSAARYCTRCGRALPPIAVYCPQCGSKKREIVNVR